ncbi:MAG: hypothetical protein KAT09_08810, partial [Candidatus Aegiribacteria sp.]|nr:hypothetical protein [Candidatus Aegiribacteria sp.]
EISGAFRKTSSGSNFGLILIIILIIAALSNDSDESEELPEPDEAYKRLKESNLIENVSIEDEREFFDYCHSILNCWKSDLEDKEKGK